MNNVYIKEKLDPPLQKIMQKLFMNTQNLDFVIYSFHIVY